MTKKEEEEWPPPKCNVSSSTELPSFVADSVPAKQGGGRADSEYSTESRYHTVNPCQHRTYPGGYGPVHPVYVRTGIGLSDGSF